MTDPKGDPASSPSAPSARGWWHRNWPRLAANLGALALLARLGWLLASGRFFLDPVKAITIRTGRLAIGFLLASLACTPLATVFKWPRIRQARRPLGLWSLVYTTLHLLTFVGWDYGFDPALLKIGVFSQPFVVVGLVAFLILLVLGVTSLRSVRRRMGRAWQFVQRLVYLAAILDVWHVLWLKKSPWEAWPYIVILAVLLVLRLSLVKSLVTRVREALTSA